MRSLSDKKTSLTFDKKALKGNTLDYYNDDMSRKAVGKLFKDVKDDPGAERGKPAPPKEEDDDLTEDLSGSAEYIDLDELETYIQKKHVNISSVFDDPGDEDYDISMYQGKKKDGSSKNTPKPAQRTSTSTPKPTPKPSDKRTTPRYKPDSDDAASMRGGGAISEINPQIKVAALVIVVVFLAILAALVFRMNSLSSALAVAEETAAKYNPDTERELEDTKIWNENLERENEQLKADLELALAAQPQPTISPNPNNQQQNNQTPGQTQTPTQATPTPLPQGERRHTVVSGDNLYNISRQYYDGSPDYVDAIMRANNMTSSDIRVGDVLIIPSR